MGFSVGSLSMCDLGVTWGVAWVLWPVALSVVALLDGLCNSTGFMSVTGRLMVTR